MTAREARFCMAEAHGGRGFPPCSGGQNLGRMSAKMFLGATPWRLRPPLTGQGAALWAPPHKNILIRENFQALCLKNLILSPRTQRNFKFFTYLNEKKIHNNIQLSALFGFIKNLLKLVTPTCKLPYRCWPNQTCFIYIYIFCRDTFVLLNAYIPVNCKFIWLSMSSLLR